MDLNKLIRQSIKEIEESGKIQEIVRNNIEDTIKKIVVDVYGPDSKFSELLRDKIKEKLEINIDKIDISSYNEILKQEIVEITSSEVKKKAREGVNNTIRKIFNEDVPKEYRLSDLLEEMKESFEYIEIEDQESMALYISDIDKWSGICFIYIDPKEDEEKYLCRNKIVIDMKTNEITSFVWDKKYVERKDVIEGLYGMNKKLFNLMAKGTKIVFDKGLDASLYDIKYKHNKYKKECI